MINIINLIENEYMLQKEFINILYINSNNILIKYNYSYISLVFYIFFSIFKHKYG